MPRKKKQPAGETPVATVLETLKEEIPGLKPATDLPVQLPPPELELKPFPRSEQAPPERDVVSTPERDPVRHERPSELNGEGSHAAAVLARRPNFRPVPEGFKNVVRHEGAGIRVNKGIERHNLGTAALQFAEDKPLSRATEYDLMEQAQKAGFQYKAATRQWERPLAEGQHPGENVIEAGEVAKEIAAARGMERGR